MLVEPQHPIAGTPDRMRALLIDPSWTFTEKVDGVRCIIEIFGGEVALLTRQGLPLNRTVSDDAMEWFQHHANQGTNVVIDAELVDGQVIAFDCPLWEGKVVPENSWAHRFYHLSSLVRDSPVALVRASPFSSVASLVEQVESEGGEGWVAYHRDAPYTPGKRNSAVLKFKIEKEIDCIVGRRQEGRDSFALHLVDEASLINVGHISALVGDGPRMKMGDVVTVRFQKVSDDRKLVHATLPKIRTDKAPIECTVQQLDEFIN